MVRNINAAGDSFVHYSLRENKLVEEEAAGDWDIAFKGTGIQVNGEAQLLQQPFDAVAEAPQDGYLPGEQAIPGGNGNGWYLYDSTSHSVFPLPGRTIVLKTRDGAYAKVEILSYYFGGPEEETITNQPRFYTFRYAYQEGGSRMLK